MAKRLVYLQDHNGNRVWAVPSFNDDAYKPEDFLYVCMHSDGNATELDIVKLPKVHIQDFIENFHKMVAGEAE